MARKFFSGNSIEQAVLQAASYHGIDPGRVAYRTRDKKHGFVNVRRKVVIEVDPESPVKEDLPVQEPVSFETELVEAKPVEPELVEPELVEPESEEEDPAEEEEADEQPTSREDVVVRVVSEREGYADDIEEEYEYEYEEYDDDEYDSDPEIAAFEKAIDRTLDVLGLDLESCVERNGKVFEIDLSGEDREFLLDRDGELLRSLNHLLPRVARGILGYGLSCRVDCDGFRASRDEELKVLAEKAAEDVRNEGEKVTLEPMNPADRRVVHLALAEDPSVLTESEGQGFLKSVSIFPA